MSKQATQDYDTVFVDRDGPTAVVTLNRPEKLNALNSALRSDLFAALASLRGDATLRAVVIWGGTKAFVAGADITEMQSRRPLDVFAPLSKSPDIWGSIGSFPVPTIAAIAGPCMGGGLELAMACDLRIAAEEAIIGQTELNVGLIPGRGGTQRLMRLVGMTRARAMVLTGEPIDAQEAQRIGLVNKVVPVGSLLDEAKRMAAKIAQKSPQSVALARYMMDAGADLNLNAAMIMESLAFSNLFSTDDMREGTQAFMDKRKPSYVGS
jgi:enoyl-CoA hydratase